MMTFSTIIAFFIVLVIVISNFKSSSCNYFDFDITNEKIVAVERIFDFVYSFLSAILRRKRRHPRIPRGAVF